MGKVSSIFSINSQKVKQVYWLHAQSLITCVRFEVLVSGIVKVAVLWDMMLYCLVDHYHCFGGTSERLITFYQTTWCHIPEDSNP
jgi:hypothetical protein